MKLLILLLAINSVTCVGQDFFADNLRNFPWTADENFDIQKIRMSKEVQLSILGGAKESLKVNRIIWTFGDSLMISHYSATHRQERLLGKFKYDLQWDKMLLNIRIDEAERLTFRLTFVSTGSFVLLSRKKVKSTKLGHKL